jgi:orotate phosphoribosyltransferase
MMQHDLLTLAGARPGHFLFESGHHGDLWLDLDRLFARPSILRPFVIELAERITQYQIGAVCGPLDGGALLARMVAEVLGCESFYSERITGLNGVTYRLPSQFRGGLRDKNVALVDDAINAGSAVRATFAELQSCGARVVALGALITLGQVAERLATSLAIPLVRSIAIESPLWTPADCLLCAAGVPLSRCSAS